MGLEIDGVSGIIKNTTSDGDVTIKGNDGGSEVTAMSFDMSAAGIATLTAGLKLTGTTPTLTVGDGGAEDAKILFDGNAQNFHIGLDDSTDKLTIGLGNTLGTYPAITIDENTNVVIPDSSLTVIGTGNYDIITLKSTDADSNVGPVLNFTRDSSSPANNDFLGELTFQGDNNAGETHDYIRMFARILNVADGSEQADFIMKDATGNNIVNFAHSEVVYNDDSVDRDFRVESNGNANMLFVDGGSDHVNIGTATDLGSTLNVAGDVTASGGSFLLNATNFLQFSNNSFARFVVNDTEVFKVTSAGLGTFSDGIVTSGDSRINVANNNNQALQIGSADDNKEAVRISHSDADNPQGIVIVYTGGSPDSGGADKFFACYDTTAERFHIDAAGDILADGVATNSDERLKENIVDATDKWDDIKALKVRNFTWKAEHHPKRNHKHIGFIAQEFETVFPALVTEHNIHPDPVYVEADKDEDGNLPEGKEIGDVKNTKNRKNIHTTAMIPMLTKALQEAMAKIETLETKVAALEG